MANRAAGKGYENEDNYSNIKFQFLGIENIHVMRNSLQKMLEGNWKSIVSLPPLGFNGIVFSITISEPGITASSLSVS